MRFFAAEKIGSKRQITPEGYLLIEGTPIARTGIQKYLPEELGHKIKPNSDGYVDITRSPDEVFAPVSIASYNGKPFVNDHPSDLIDHTTWRNLALGVVMNPRRGEGEYEDHLIADLLIADKYAIELVDTGKVELSCGYNAEYFETGAGTGEQRNIIGNHVALVSEGRCGPTCAIGDHSHCNPLNSSKEAEMAKTTLRAKLMNALGVTDKAGLDKMLDEANEGGGLHIHMGGDNEGEDPMEAFGKRMDAMEAGMKTMTDYVTAKSAEDKAAKDAKAKDEAEEKEKKEKEEKEGKGEDAEAEKELEEEAPAGTGDQAKVAKDSAYLADAYQASVALGEILVPGFSPPTFDKAAAPKLSLKAICDFRKRVLDAANSTTDGKVILNDVLAGKTLDTSKMNCAQTRSLFFAAGAAKKAMNNGASSRTGDHGPVIGATGSKAIRSVGDLSRRAAELYSKKGSDKSR